MTSRLLGSEVYCAFLKAGAAGDRGRQCHTHTAGPIGLILGIVEIIKQNKVKSSMEKTTVRNKPEFQFPNSGKQVKEKKKEEYETT